MAHGRYRNVFLASIAVAAASPAIAQDALPLVQPERVRELVHLVRQDCGSCHGLTLQGGLGPALTPPALRDKPRESLIATILGGRPGTPMPPFRGIVVEEEAAWIVDRLSEGFPADQGAAR